MTWRPKWSIATIALTVIAAAASASPAAAVTIGQVAPGATDACTAPFDIAQGAVAAGDSYTVPATGGSTSWTITSWSTKNNAGVGKMLTMKVFRETGTGIYTVVGHDGPRLLTPSGLNTFTSDLRVKPGDLLGLHNSVNFFGCSFDTGLAGDIRLTRGGELADGSAGVFGSFSTRRLNIAAVVEPSNTFTLGKPKLNKKKGKATLTVEVPNPGELTASGKGVKAASGAVISKTVAAGTAKLVIKAKGKQAKKLKKKGKVKLKAKITYTPTGGAAGTQTKKLSLKRKLKRKKR